MATAVGIDLGTTNSVIAAWQGGAPSVTSGCRGSRSWATKTSEVVECSSVPVLVDLCATWCGPCRMVSPALEQLATERAGQLKLVKVDVDKAPAVAQQLAIQAVPTLGPQRP
ncbi:MAG: thioredoxin [Mycobacterium sp.]|jgi:thioredoxin|nr:thioredoxin [Mycobacterium sp.]MDT5248773.1 thioredoxin 2 [Mycobacterium sp.]